MATKWNAAAACVAVAACLLLAPTAGRADGIDDLAREFWQWRAVEQPLSVDDIARITRPRGWVPDWSPAAVANRREALVAFETRWNQIDSSHLPVARQVDYRLIGAALARVRWELEIVKSWQRDPRFYLDQTLWNTRDLIVHPPPFDKAISKDIVGRLASIPKTLEDAQANLERPAAPFTRRALDTLKDVRAVLTAIVRELNPLLSLESKRDLGPITERAIAALELYRAWLEHRLPGLPENIALGRDNYLFFLRNIALVPYSLEYLLEESRRERLLATAQETYERRRNENLAPPARFKTQAEEISATNKAESSIAEFFRERGILTVPAHACRALPLPAYLEHGSVFGLTDFTAPERLSQDGVIYVGRPDPPLGFYDLATVEDPRIGVAHECVAHYWQLTSSYANSDTIRRHYYDSAANEGLAFYAEGLLLDLGLYDDHPHSRETFYKWKRFRALRVVVDIKMALGLLTMDQAEEYLVENVPMDRASAREEVELYTQLPGLAAGYSYGRQQFIEFLGEARQIEGDGFDLRKFDDYVWSNGNLPVVLQRWDYLGKRDQIDALDQVRREERRESSK